MTATDAEASWRPDPIEAITTGVVAAVVSLAAVVPAVRSALGDLAFFLLEIVSRVLDNPPGLIVGGYVVLTAAAIGLEPFRRRIPREALPVWLLLCSLAVLGQGYLVVLALKLQPAWLIGAAVLGAAWGWRSRTKPRSTVLPAAPVVALFVVLHLAVEGTAGHILTPWMHGISSTLAGWSTSSAVAWWGVVLLIVAAPVALASWSMSRLGVRPIGWLHPDPRRLVQTLTIPSLLALAVVGAHYGTAVWACPPSDADGIRRLSARAGAFDLQTSAGGTLLLASLREERELLLIELPTGRERTTSTVSPADSMFARTEPETLVPLDDGRFAVLLASSATEQGNHLAILDPITMTLSEPLKVRGVSDLVRDGRDGVWISTEYAGKLARIDPASGRELLAFDVRGAETNKVVVEAATGQAWSVGLWRDSWLRRIDLSTGREVGRVELGTHQWDMALSAQHRRCSSPA